jgi:hypothetical protein
MKQPAKPGKKPARKKTTPAKRKVGRPTNFRPIYIDQAYKMTLLGYKDAELAQFFEVSEQTIYTWKDKHPEFVEAIKKGKDIADATIVRRLWDRANGVKVQTQKVVSGGMMGPMAVDVEETYPPETAAMIFWLKNRQPKLWRDKQEVDMHATVTMPDIHIEPYGSDEGEAKD